MRNAVGCALLLVSLVALAEPMRILDLSGGTPGFPLEEACEDLGQRAQVTGPEAGRPVDIAAADVLLLNGATDPAKLGIKEGALAAFVRDGGGILIAGLPDNLPQTSALWKLLGEAAPADVTAVDLFPDNSGDWMWIPPQEGETPDHIRYIRKSIEITKPVKRAFIRCTVDNLYWVYLNGEQVGYHWSWFDNELWEITGKLKQGKNVVGFKGRNVDGPGGFFAQIGIEYADGTRELIVSDKSWKFHIPEEEGWANIEFDDSAWGTATYITPMVKRSVLPDRALEVKGPLTFDEPHPIFNAIANRFGTEHFIRGVLPRAGAQIIARVGEHPLMIAQTVGEGRVLLIDAVQRPGAIGSSDMSDDILTTSILWLGKRQEGVTIADARYPPAALTRHDPCTLGFALKEPRATVNCTLTVTLTHDGKPLPKVWEFSLRPDAAPPQTEGKVNLRGHQSEGTYELALTAKDERGNVVFRRDTATEVKNPVNLALAVPSNRTVTAEGFRIDFHGTLEGALPERSVLSAAIVGPRGEELTTLEGRKVEDGFAWSYEVPNLAEGDYELLTRVTRENGEIIDESRLVFHVVPRVDSADFYPTTMRLSKFATLDKRAIEREIDEIIAHGFNTLTFSARRLGAAPGSLYDHAEDYAQRKGMAVSYSFQGTFSILGRNALPSVSVFSPEYEEAIRPRIEQAVATCKLVPRLLNVQGYMDEPFQISGKTFDDRPPAQAEFKRRYGIDMPTREEAMKDPALWLKYVDFWSDCFATGWRQSYAMVKEMYPDFWVELTHDSHCTFGAAGRDFKGFWAVDDVYHWGAPFDSVNYDIYPYLSTDYRTGKFQENRLPRIAGMHMAFAEMRNLAYTYNKKLGFWLESGWGGKLATDSELKQYYWSPRELTMTAIAAGCDYLNTFWGIPQDERWWETYRGVMNEVKSIAPLLMRSRVPRAKAAFLFPRTQHVLLQEEYWNVMVALEAFRQAYGELDCIHEDQLAEGKLDEYKTLVLFDIHLMKRASAETIRDWCEKGGTILADEVPSLDELKHPLGIFEDIFGVTGTADIKEGPFELDVAERKYKLWGMRSYTAKAGGKAVVTAGDHELGFAQAAGKGRALLCNFPAKDCYLDALIRDNGNGDADLILEAFRARDPVPNVSSSNLNIEAAARQTPEGVTLLFVINHESKDPKASIEVHCAPPGGVVRDLVTGEVIKHAGNYAVELECPWGETRLLGIFPSDPKGLSINGLPKAARAGDTVDYTLTVGGEDIRGNYLLDISVIGPDGKRREAFSGRTCTRNASCERTIGLPINAEKGTWVVKATSAWDGATTEASLEVE